MLLVEVGGQVVVEGDGDVLVAVDVEEHALHRGRPPDEEQVLRVGAATGCPPGLEADLRALRDRDPGDADRVLPRVDLGVDGRLPPRQHVGRRRSPSPIGRISPWRLANTSGENPSIRSTMAAARGSVLRASRFSSSVSVRMRSARISSISVASHMSPGLSAATAGWS